MSRLQALIVELCPDGVPFLPIGDPTVSERVIAGATPKSGVAEYWKNGTIPWMSSGEVNKGVVYSTDKLITQAAYAATSTKMVPSGAVVIALAGQGKTRGTVARTRIDLCTNQSLASIVTAESMHSDFLYYFLTTQYAQLRDASSGEGARGGLNLQIIRSYHVPVPPLEVQREIVRILEQFKELEAELGAELEARHRQYSHYWNQVLTPNAGWQRTTLGAIAEVFDGPHATPKKTDVGPWYLSISSLINGRFDLSQSARLGTDQFAHWTRRVAAQPGDTMFSYETRLGQAAYWDRDEPAALGRRMGLLRPRTSEVVPRFLTLLYLGPDFQKLIRSKTVRGATVERIPIANMADWQVLVPQLDEQQRIVETLDAFDALVNNYSVGLPAEIVARRQQYEHYRNQLLAFQKDPS